MGVHEIKHDGYRLMVRRDGETVHLFTRNGYDWTERFPAIAFGGLERESPTFLDSLARRGASPRRQFKPGTVLVREYQGARHTVTVGREGFEWQGRTYPSLSAIARAITGTAWSGPRFFAVRTAADHTQTADRCATRSGPRTRRQHGAAAAEMARATASPPPQTVSRQ